MAYSPSTRLLYVVANIIYTGVGGTRQLSGSTSSAALAYQLQPGTPRAAVGCFGNYSPSGAPSIIATGGAEYVLLPSSNRVTSFSVNAGATACSPAGVMGTTSWKLGVYSASTDGSTVFAGHDNGGLGKATFSAGTFGAVVDASPSTSKISSNLALAGQLFFADTSSAQSYRSYDPATLLATSGFASASGAAGSLVTQPPVVAAGHLFGIFNSADGRLHAWTPSTGASQFVYPGTGVLTNISPVAVGSDSEIYFAASSSANPAQLFALSVSGATPKLDWGFAGSSSIAISAPTTEPALDSAGTAYFGDAAGSVFAVITDSATTFTPTVGKDWPRVGFDNCNSNNTAFNCQ
jgi:hypothetical protein